MFALVTLVSPQTAVAYQFTPTEHEWTTWPGYCKARYAESMWGAQTAFGSRMSASAKAEWRNALGAAYNPLHHYCAGLAYMQRYAATIDPEVRVRALKYALEEFAYTYPRVPSSSYLFPDVATNYGVALHKNGEPDRAVEILFSAIAANPKHSSAYAALSMIYGKMNQADKQIEILQQGIEATEGQSAELHYFLGLQLAKAKRYELAREHAIQAYAQGYPLPGLKNRLKRAGYSLEDSS